MRESKGNNANHELKHDKKNSCPSFGCGEITIKKITNAESRCLHILNLILRNQKYPYEVEQPNSNQFKGKVVQCRYLPKKPLTHRHGGGKQQKRAYHEQKSNLNRTRSKPCERGKTVQ